MYSKYITYEEMLHLWDCESERTLSLLTTRDRILAIERQFEILDKIDKEEVMRDWEIKMIDLRTKHKKHACHELGAREFTFTYSPKWCSDDEARRKMTIAIDKLVKYYKNDIIQFRAIGEIGKLGNSHVHCFYKLKRGLKITDKNFQRAYSFWDTNVKQGPTGHKGGHHANVRNEADFKGYIEKEVESAWLDVNINNEDPE